MSDFGVVWILVNHVSTRVHKERKCGSLLENKGCVMRNSVWKY